jgi:hypothetical protein
MRKADPGNVQASFDVLGTWVLAPLVSCCAPLGCCHVIRFR